MNVQYCFPAAGTVRTPDGRIAHLYQKASQYIEQACLWEGLFQLACLVTNRPAEEPVADAIRKAAADTENGAFNGRFAEQICTARAVFALFEYTADRKLLRRIADWLRYTEAEFDSLILQDGVLYRPADFMELLVRFYQASGARPALRLCARLRSDAFDWVTALHTLQQSIPFGQKTVTAFSIPEGKPAEIDFDEREKLINHAELIADGVRYSLFAGLFSGHSQDLSAAKTAWTYLARHHCALCGGTTGNPFLGGSASDQPVSNSALAAWTEAFAAQMMFPDHSWATDELIRIIYNGLDDCLNRDRIPPVQMVNRTGDGDDAAPGSAELYARIARAAATAFHHAVSLTETGIRINYPMPGRYMIMEQKQPLILRMDGKSVSFQCREPLSAVIYLYLSPLGTCSARVLRDEDEPAGIFRESREGKGTLLRLETVWDSRIRILYIPDQQVLTENVHHQGQAYISFYRLMCMPVSENGFAAAAAGEPFRKEEETVILTVPVENWTIRNGQPGDIPVLPAAAGNPGETVLRQYSACRSRIAMFPRAR